MLDYKIIIDEFLYGINRDIHFNKTNFKLPIELNDKKISLNNNLICDLELFDNNDISNNINSNSKDISNNDISYNVNNKNLYNYVFNPTNYIEQNITNKWSKYYTTDVSFINDTQCLLKNFVDLSFDNNYIDMYESFENIADDNNFISKYQYIDLPILHKYNNNSYILNIYCINNFISPLLSIFIPILFLFLPYFMIKLQNKELTIDEYLTYLKSIFHKHPIGNLIFNFNNTNFSSKIYMIFTVVMYFYQIYQNIFLCKKFYNNLHKINNFLHNIRDYINKSITRFNKLLDTTSKLLSYNNFNNTITNNIFNLINYRDKLNYITIHESPVKNLFNIGYLMKNYYLLNNDKNLIETIYYSFNLNVYINNMSNLKKMINDKNMNYCTFNNNKYKIKNVYYPPLLDKNNLSESDIVKNNIYFDKNLIITGPNASGKTTTLKSIMFNILLSQQIGCGFYDTANLKIYDYLHSYINIPDTSNRDSLFQAEARRCKNIIDSINNNLNKNHFCIFDELYSGTNPDEAVKSGLILTNYINNRDNVNFILTTHYKKLCKKIKNINKYKMSITKLDNNKFKYNYNLVKGISNDKGGLVVLENMNYPNSLLNKYKEM